MKYWIIAQSRDGYKVCPILIHRAGWNSNNWGLWQTRRINQSWQGGTLQSIAFAPSNVPLGISKVEQICIGKFMGKVAKLVTVSGGTIFYLQTLFWFILFTGWSWTAKAGGDQAFNRRLVKHCNVSLACELHKSSQAVMQSHYLLVTFRWFLIQIFLLYYSILH